MAGEVTDKPHSAVVFGVGASNGLGAALAKRFAREGLQTYVVGRTEEKLTTVSEDITAGGWIAYPRLADVTEESDVIAVLDEVAAGSELDIVVYNVGNNVASPLLDLSTDVFESAWRQNGLGGFIVGREAVRRLLPLGRGTLIFTGATASVRARPPFTAFASAKAALRAVSQAIAREFGPLGIHVAHVIIDGVIEGDYAKSHFPDFVKAKGEDGLLKVDDIAEAYWLLHRQPKSSWTHELDLRPFKETF